MYCRNCGYEVSDKAIMCVACGTPPMAGNRYCYNCKTDTTPNATICMNCGVGLNNNAIVHVGKDWLATLLLAIFLGGLGVHMFYTGHIGIGVFQLLTFGGFGIWALIDIILIATDNFKDAEGNRLIKN